MTTSCDISELVSKPNLANCLENFLFERITKKQTDLGWFSELADAINIGKLQPTYVFCSPFSKSKKCYGYPLLHLAVVCDRADVVELLLKHGTVISQCIRQRYSYEPENDDKFQRSTLYHSLWNSSIDVFNVLIQFADSDDITTVDSENCSLLWHAVSIALHEKISAMVKSRHGPLLINMPNKSNLFPLHVAVINNDRYSVELLLSGGARLTVRQHENLTPVGLAAKRGATSALKALLMHGADPNDDIPAHCAVLALQPPVPFRKTMEQITSTLAILWPCGARLPYSYEPPEFAKLMLPHFWKQPLSLQMACILAIRKQLLTASGDRSIKKKTEDLVNIIPKQLSFAICFEFLNR